MVRSRPIGVMGSAEINWKIVGKLETGFFEYVVKFEGCLISYYCVPFFDESPYNSLHPKANIGHSGSLE